VTGIAIAGVAVLLDLFNSLPAETCQESNTKSTTIITELDSEFDDNLAKLISMGFEAKRARIVLVEQVSSITL
jgi:hypothetical protein